MKKFLAHLRCHPIPEIMDEGCLAALASVEAEYGDTITHGAGLEVRLGEEARYVDYIMNIDEQDIPYVAALWYEIDYAEFKKAHETGAKIQPCLFANVEVRNEEYGAFWDKVLPPFMGEKRAQKLRAPLDRVTAALPEGAYIKQIGTMSSRGELDIMRLVIMFPSWESISPGIAAVGWPGNIDALRAALLPWKETHNLAVDLDLGEGGVLPKIGIEALSRWRHPLIVDKFITRLEEAGLCLPSKGEALRRWIRIRPDGDPFIQTLVAYFKLNYKDGKITEAKAYLEQSPYLHHHYFDAYERPVYVELAVKDEYAALPVDEAVKWLHECSANRVRQVRFTGEVTSYEHLGPLLAECQASNIFATVELGGTAPREWLEKTIAAGAGAFLVDVSEEEENSLRTLEVLHDSGLKDIRARWFLRGDNAKKLPSMIRLVEKSGVWEFIITGLKAPAQGALPTGDDLEFVAQTIKTWRKTHQENVESAAMTSMKLTVESCFSPLRAFMEGSNPKKNGNRGIERGCTAGRDHFTVLLSGHVTPCRYLDMGEAYGDLAEYWTASAALQDLRHGNAPMKTCEKCAYKRRCLPCAEIMACPLKNSVL